MRVFLFFLLSLVACTKAAPPMALLPGPEVDKGWESSGGDGVACFADEAEALKADRAGLGLPEPLRQKIVSVRALEHFEHPEYSYTSLDGKDREAILAVLMERFRKYSPIFHSRLELAGESIRTADWKNRGNLADVADSRPKENIARADAKCRLLQMAIRHSRSTPGKLPEVWVEVDLALFQKMAPLDQAMLVLHERMYLLGREVGHKNSDFLRGVVAELFSDIFGTAVETIPHFSLRARYLQNKISAPYGDYYLFFLEDPQTFLPQTPPGYHPYSRYRSFGTLLGRLRERKRSCLDEKKDEETCSFYAVNPALLKGTLTDEEAFVYLSRWLLDAVGAIDTSENFVVWNQKAPTEASPYQQAQLARACAHLKQSDYIYFKVIVKQALGYCEAVIPPTSSVSQTPGPTL